MKIFDYMFPSESELLLIIAIIYIFAVFVFWRCYVVKMKTQSNMELLDENNPNSIVDITKLSNYFSDQSIPFEEKNFDNFAMQHGKNKDTEALFDHLNTMWSAKARGKSFDTEILVDKTIEKIFDGTDTIKAMISLFLVCGILGTLFGLAISLEHFDPSKFITNNGDSKDFSMLFGNLKSAFAPSINGVIATIIFVLGYTYFIQEKCINALNQKLTVITIKKWVPVLFPSESEESVKEINAAIDKANRISENYEEMNDGLDNVVSKLGEANETVSRVITASDALKDTANTFKDGANVIGELTESVQALTTQSTDLKTAVTTIVSQAVQNAATLHQNSVTMLSDSVKDIVGTSQGALNTELEALQAGFEIQKKQLEEVISTLKLYDSHFAESNSKVQDGLVQSCQNIGVAVKDLQSIHNIIDEKDRKIMAAIGQPLTEQLQGLAQSIAMQLNQITVKIGSLQDPMSESAKLIQTMFSNMARHNEQLAEKLAKSGMTKEQIEAITKQIPQNITVDNSALEAKLDVVIGTLENVGQTIREANTKNSVNKSNGFINTRIVEDKLDEVVQQLKSLRINPVTGEPKYKKLFSIAGLALLFISIVLQGIIVLKLYDLHDHINYTEGILLELESSQSKVNKMILDKQN